MSNWSCVITEKRRTRPMAGSEKRESDPHPQWGNITDPSYKVITQKTQSGWNSSNGAR